MRQSGDSTSFVPVNNGLGILLGNRKGGSRGKFAGQCPVQVPLQNFRQFRVVRAGRPWRGILENLPKPAQWADSDIVSMALFGLDIVDRDTADLDTFRAIIR